MGGVQGSLNWIQSNVPKDHLKGKVAIVTGANSGLGLETVRVLANRGAHVILACRNETKAIKAIDELVAGVSHESKTVLNDLKCPRENLEYMNFDLSDLDSVRKFSETFASKYDKLDLLICNAGIMALPKLELNAQGIENQFATNVLGHYVLTCMLAPLLKKGSEPRLVYLSSVMHLFASGIDLTNIDCKKGYQSWPRYAETKVADLILMRQFADKMPGVICCAAHPGYAATQLQTASGVAMWNFVAKTSMAGTLPTILAATGKDIKSKDYCGPGILLQYGSPISNCYQTSVARDKILGEKLWAYCEEITNVKLKE